jgi:hypothetical protein
MKIASPIVVWAVHFGLIYGFTGLACARGWERAVPWTVGAATILAAVLTLALILTNLSSGFTRWMTAAVAALALVAILFEGVPVLLIPACGSR